MESIVASILSLLSVLVTGYFTYNQYRHDRLTDLELKRKEEEFKKATKTRNDSNAKILGALYRLLVTLKADRVFILQPHPLDDGKFLSVRYEVNAIGVSDVKPSWNKVRMQEVPKMVDRFCSEDLIITKLSDVSGNRSRAIFANNGSSSVVVGKCTDTTHDWVGSIICDYLEVDQYEKLDKERIKLEMERAILCISYILPPIDEE